MTRSVLKASLAAGALLLSGTALAADPSQHIDLTYVWTAHDGKAEQLVQTYAAVGEVLEANEPGLLLYEISVSETGDQIVIHEVFEDADALAYHLQETAAKFFPELVTFATPGPFIFKGDVPEELKAAAYSMDMGAIFAGEATGFER